VGPLGDTVRRPAGGHSFFLSGSARVCVCSWDALVIASPQRGGRDEDDREDDEKDAREGWITHRRGLSARVARGDGLRRFRIASFRDEFEAWLGGCLSIRSARYPKLLFPIVEERFASCRER
jgi:hypothetical protein